MKLRMRDIVKYTKWDRVQASIKYHYPHDKNNYKPLFDWLNKVPTVRTKPGESLEIYGGFDPNTSFAQTILNGYKRETDEQSYGIHMKKDGDETNWSISFTPWKYLANLPILADTLDHYNFEDIVAHFIWEITFYGTEKDAKKTFKEVNRRVKEVVNES